MKLRDLLHALYLALRGHFDIVEPDVLGEGEVHRTDISKRNDGS